MKGAKAATLLNLAILIASWVIGARYYTLLPDRIPIHYDLSGQANGWASKSFWSVFIVPLAQTFLALLFALLSRYPQYSNIPTTIALEALQPEVRECVYAVVRKMLSLICAAVNAFMLILYAQMLRAAVDPQPQLDTRWLIILTIGLALLITISTVRAFRAMRRIVKAAQDHVEGGTGR